MLCLHAQDFSKIMRPHYRWVVYAWGSEGWVRRGVFDDQQWAEAVARQSLFDEIGWVSYRLLVMFACDIAVCIFCI